MGKIRWLQSSDMPLWDSFVEKHPHGTIYHLSSWQSLIEKSFRHIKGHIAALCADDSNEILAGIPVYAIQSRFTGNRIVSIPFATLCDPLISSVDEMKQFLPFLIDLYTKNKALNIEIRTWKSSVLNSFESFGMSDFYYHHYLVLDRAEEVLMESFHKKAVRVSIIRAKRNNLQLGYAGDDSDLPVFFELFSQSRKRLGLPLIPFRYLETLWEIFYPTGNLQILFAMHDGKAIAASMLLKYKDLVIIEYGFDQIQHRNLSPNHFLDWETVKLAKREGYKVLSFGRTSAQNKGLMLYKQRWGTTVESLSQFYYPLPFYSTFENKETSLKYRLFRGVAKRVPDSIFHLMSDFIYRHMG